MTERRGREVESRRAAGRADALRRQ